MSMGFPVGSVVGNPPANAGDAGEVSLIPGWEDPMHKNNCAFEEKALHTVLSLDLFMVIFSPSNSTPPEQQKPIFLGLLGNPAKLV